MEENTKYYWKFKDYEKYSIPEVDSFLNYDCISEEEFFLSEKEESEYCRTTFTKEELKSFVDSGYLVDIYPFDFISHKVDNSYIKIFLDSFVPEEVK